MSGFVDVVGTPAEGRLAAAVLAAAGDEPGARLRALLGRHATARWTAMADRWHLHLEPAVAERLSTVLTEIRSPGFVPPPGVDVPAPLARLLRGTGFDLYASPEALHTALAADIERGGAAVQVDIEGGSWTATLLVPGQEPFPLTETTALAAVGKAYMALRAITEPGWLQPRRSAGGGDRPGQREGDRPGQTGPD